MDVRVVVQQEFNETTLQIKLTLGKTPCVIFHFFLQSLRDSMQPYCMLWGLANFKKSYLLNHAIVGATSMLSLNYLQGMSRY